MSVRLVPVVIVLACLLGVCAPAVAVVYVDGSASGHIHNGSSWQTAFTSIGQALSSMPNGGEVWVRAGTYPERLLLKLYTKIYGGFLGFETSTDQRLIGAFPTIISGGRKGRVIDMPTGSRVTLDGLTIRGGKADRGGGIRCTTNSVANISNCRIENCEATARAGGVLYDTYAQGRMENCLIAHNKALSGGGVVIEYHSYPTLQGNVIVRNHATLSGGGVYCPFHSGALLVNCTVAYNHADLNGGGIYAYYGGPETFNYCIVAFNTAPAGGGLYADGGRSSVTLSGCDWCGNSVGDLGGWLTSLPAGGANITSDPMFLMPDAEDYHLTVGSPCAGIGAFALSDTYAIDRIGVAKRLADGASVRLANKVVGTVDGDTIYLQEPDRSSAIAVHGITGCTQGRIVTSVAGTLSTVAGARVLEASSFALCASATFSPKPVAVRVSWLSTAAGIYARTWGSVDALTPDGFVLRDGQYWVNVRFTGARPPVGDVVSITGTYGIGGAFIARDLVTITRAAAP